MPQVSDLGLKGYSLGLALGLSLGVSGFLDQDASMNEGIEGEVQGRMYV